MSSPTVVFITGVSRGIGLAVVKAYLSCPNHVVIGSVRDTKTPKAEELKKLPAASGSRLLLVSIENTSASDPKKAAEAIKAAGISHIDIMISSAGVSPPPAPLHLVDPESLVDTFKVNSVAMVLLFQAVNELFIKAEKPKWISISSRIGSVGQAAEFYCYAPAYGMSKAAQNWFTATLHHTNPAIIAFAVHPGFVLTDMGVAAATSAGIAMPATSAEESAIKLLELIADSSREATSGKLIDIMTREEYLW